MNADVIATQRGTLFAHNQYCYCRNNAIGNKDSDGLYWETAMDLTSLYYSAEDYYKDPSLENYGWYLLDLVCVALPIASGPGAARRAAKVIDGAMDVVTLANKVDDVGDVAKAVEHAGEAADAMRTSQGSKVTDIITGYTKHGINQAISRNGVGVSTSAIFHTIKNPVKITRKVDQAGRISIRYVSKASVVVLNSEGKVISVWAKASDFWRVIEQLERVR